ncbi:MAG: N-acetylneuraminate synthase family protein [Candidatus Colwellbacteria bacterium]|nr:N-acetylneuraminate synthase family protein [Candidatus Colwellbacteria bacterium]
MKSTRKIVVGNKTIGYGEPVFIIAEAGVNHNGELEKALQLVDIAAEAGADAVKFQTFRAEQVVIESGEMAEYQRKNIGEGSASRRSQREMLRELELKEEFYQPIMDRCREKGIIFFSAPHGGKASVDFLESLDIPLYKIGSGDLTNYIFLERVAATKKPIILSTAMSFMYEVKDAIDFLKKGGVVDLALLHCTTNYPCPLEEVNLAAMVRMMEELDAIVGYSDHTLGQEVAVVIASLGAAIYERHFTIDKSLPGPDHTSSDSLEEFKEKVEAIRRTAIGSVMPDSLLMGSDKKEPTKSELASMRLTIRKSIVAAGDMEAGHVIEKDDLEAKRPGDGVSPTEFERFTGGRLKRAVQADQQLKFEDIE